MLWAYSHRHSIRRHAPPFLFGFHGAFGKREMYHWIAEAPIYSTLLRTPVSQARNYWWSSALDNATVPWALFLSFVGERRRIPHLWAYAALSQLVGLSYAQGLFYTALLLVPVPMPKNAREMTGEPRVLTRWARWRKNVAKRPDGWCASPIVYLASILATYGAIFLTPVAADTTTFLPLAFTSRLLPFLPLTIPYLVPTSWGTIHPHPHAAHSRYTNLFRLCSLLSFALYAKAGAYAIMYNDPGTTYYDPTLMHPLHHSERAAFERGSTTVGRILAAAFGGTGISPAMAKTGWDVLLSALLLGAWAGVRGTEPSAVLRNMGVMGLDSSQALGDIDGLVEDAKDLAEKAVHGGKKTIEEMVGDKHQEELKSENKRTLRGKRSYADVAKEAATSDNDAHTDEEEHHDSPPSGRKGKSYAAVAAEAPSSSSNHKTDTARQRKKQGKRTMTEREDDAPYVPDNADNEEYRGDEEGAGELDTESAALAWGVVAFAGLGAGTACVLGGESLRG